MANRAPGSLGFVQDFVNTLDVEQSADDLRSPEKLREWLAGRGLLTEAAGEAVTPADLARAVEVREALRRLLVANNGGARSQADVEVLDRVALAAGLRPRFARSAAHVALEPAAPGVAGGLGRLLAVVAGAMNDGSWVRLKACAEHSCQWAFYDRTKNHSGHWCEMAVCGNRSKARQFRQRRRAGAGPSPTATGP